MEPRLLFLILVGIAIGLSCLAGYWRKKAGEAAFAAALLADKAEDRDRHCRLAVMAGHRDACRMFCFAHPDFYEDRHPLKPFRFRGISVTFYGHYYPSRYKRLLDEEQRGFCRTLYAFKEGENHGIDFFKACMAALPVDTTSCHIMFMPCSNWIKYGQRFKRLDWYITTNSPPDCMMSMYTVNARACTSARAANASLKETTILQAASREKESSSWTMCSRAARALPTTRKR